ncbi:MAG: lipoprotein-releasing ABC transporter ATP-binding protein LolD [Succinivibrio sp.]|nr:lipoprotein-releasing ABC transporter ATP-binding protein LolD [Succinivibrio sp.]
MQEIILQARDIRKTYQEGTVATEVLKGVNLDIRSDEITAIIGKSGSGKSTLLHILGTLDTQSSGSLKFKGQELSTLSNSDKAKFRNKSLGFVYQFHHLLGDFTAKENVMMPLLIAGISSATAEQTAKNYLEKVGLLSRLDYKPGEMSGGERQRVAIARALCGQPQMVLADEPTGNLDATNASSVFDLFNQLVHEQHTAVVMVTHDRSLAERCDRIVEIKDGTVNV